MSFFKKKKNLTSQILIKENAERKPKIFSNKLICINPLLEIKKFFDFNELLKSDDISEAMMAHIDNLEFVGVNPVAYLKTCNSKYQVKKEDFIKTLNLAKDVASFTKRSKEVNKEILLTTAFLMARGNNFISENSFESNCSFEDGTQLTYKLILSQNSLNIEKTIYNSKTGLRKNRSVNCQKTYESLKIKINKNQAMAFDPFRGYSASIDQDISFESKEVSKEIDIDENFNAIRTKQIQTKKHFIKNAQNVFELDLNSQFSSYPFSNYTQTDEIFRVNKTVSVCRTLIEGISSETPCEESYHIGASTDKPTELTCTGYLRNIDQPEFNEITKLSMEEREKKFADVEGLSFRIPANCDFLF